MGFGRRSRRNYGDNGYRKKRKLKTQIRFIGVIVFIIGLLVALYETYDKNHNFASYQQYSLISIGLLVIGMVMILQRKLLDVLKDMGKPRCNCCKCTNCDSNHNHWTHD
jgi:uncharacterized membrane protein